MNYMLYCIYMYMYMCRCNDQIVAVNNTSVANMKTDKVRAFLSSLPPGPITLTLERPIKTKEEEDTTTTPHPGDVGNQEPKNA